MKFRIFKKRIQNFTKSFGHRLTNHCGISDKDGQGLLFVGRAHDVASELEKLKTKFRVIYL